MAKTIIAADIFDDAVNGADLSTRAGWQQIPGYAGSLKTQDGKVYYTLGTAGYAYTAAQPASPDYNVSATYSAKATLQLHNWGVMGRALLTGTTTNCYFFGYSKADAAWYLTKVVNGTTSTIKVGSAVTISPNVDYRVRLEMIGTTLNGYVSVNGGAEVLAATVTDTSLTGAGYGGLRSSSTPVDTATTGQHADFFLIETVDDAAPPADPTLTLAALANRRVLQRDGPTGSAVVSGTFANLPSTVTSIEVRIQKSGVTVADWTALSSLNVQNGAFSGRFSAPTGAWYTMQARALNGATVLASDVSKTAIFGVGDLVAFAGSSTKRRYFTDYPATYPDLVAVTRNGTTWAAGGNAGLGAATYANELLAAAPGVPIGFLDMAEGGTTLRDEWSKTTYAGFTALVEAINSAKGGAVGVQFVDLQIGRNDAQGEYVTNFATQLALFRTLAANLRAATSLPNLRIMVGGSQAGRNETSATGNGGFYDLERRVELVFARDENNAFASNNYDLARLTSDGTHLTEAATPIHARRAAAVGAALIAGTPVASAQGPEIVSALAEDDTHTIVSIRHRAGNDIAPATGITNFQINVGGGWIAATGARLSATRVRLTHASRGGVAGMLAYAAFEQPDIPGTLKDNSAKALPADPTFVNISTTTPFVISVTDASGTVSETKFVEVN